MTISSKKKSPNLSHQFVLDLRHFFWYSDFRHLSDYKYPLSLTLYPFEAVTLSVAQHVFIYGNHYLKYIISTCIGCLTQDLWKDGDAKHYQYMPFKGNTTQSWPQSLSWYGLLTHRKCTKEPALPLFSLYYGAPVEKRRCPYFCCSFN